MIKVKSFDMFSAMCDELNSASALKMLYGTHDIGKSSGVKSLNDETKALNVQIVLLSQLGTVFYKESINLEDTQTCDRVTEFFKSNSVLPAKVICNGGEITIT
jgi:hypothetical protein